MEKAQNTKIKGVILAGGFGTRLRPLTLITNKHLLPVYDKPMILYPLETLKASGVTDIMIVCGREHAGHFMQFLGSGKEYGVKLSYALQDKNNGGIADALSYTEDFADTDAVAVVLGDNIFEHDFSRAIRSFKRGAMVALKKVSDPNRFGVAVFSKDKKTIVKIEEKPKRPKSDLAQTGFYLFDNRIYSIIRSLTPSARGELEITDAVNRYIALGELDYTLVRGRWLDAGTFESLFKAAEVVRQWGQRR